MAAYDIDFLIDFAVTEENVAVLRRMVDIYGKKAFPGEADFLQRGDLFLRDPEDPVKPLYVFSPPEEESTGDL